MISAVTQKKVAVAVLSILSNSTLVALKLVVGLIIGSVSILSEAIHSGVDLVAAVIAYASVRRSGEPADHEHPFGHGKFENLSGAVEALLIFVAAIWIIYEAVHKLLFPKPLDAPALGVLIMFVSAGANLVVSKMLFKVGKDTDSIALMADGWHLMTDVYTSAGVMVGLALIWIGEALFPSLNLEWLDPIAALLVALLILKAAWKLTSESVGDLMDVSLSDEEEQWIRVTIPGVSPLVRGYHGLRTRKSGPYRFIELHLIVDARMSVADSHGIADTLEARIRERFPHGDVTIHIEPCVEPCKPDCLPGCLNPDKKDKPVAPLPSPSLS